jgi:hypothetical protein
MSDHKERYERGELATTSGQPPKQFDSPAPDPETFDEGSHKGQHKDYWVLSESERAKGFVRPVRSAYRHAKCGTVTTMGRALAETCARDPHFYGSTFCVSCGSHFRVGADGEFTWDGTNEKVGT